MTVDNYDYPIPPPLNKKKKCEFKRHECYEMINSLVQRKFTGKFELNFTQGTIISGKTEEIIKL